jgi:hypothetical protein
MKKSKLSTPEWIKEGYDSPEAYNKAKGVSNKKKSGKTFKVRECPKCKSDNVCVVLGKEEGKGKGEWECKKCKWVGFDIKERELTEEEFIDYLDKKEKEVK